MKKNISRFTLLDNTILLEYIINNEYQNYDSDSYDVDMYQLYYNESQVLFTKPISDIDTGLLYIDNEDKNTNNGYKHLAVPLDKTGTEWFVYKNDKKYVDEYLIFNNYNNSISKKTNLYNSSFNVAYDTIRLHILSGYTFEDVYGIMLKVSTLNDNAEIINLANWIYRNNDREYIYEKPIINNNKIFDKYIEFKIPSIQFLRGIEYNESSEDDIMRLKKDLSIKENNLANINISYSTINKKFVEVVYDENELNKKVEKGVKFIIDGNLYLQIPYNSQADNFNLFLEEASDGDYFNFYTTWNDYPLNNNIVSLFNTKIKLYETKKVNELYNSIYEEPEKESNWVVVHELTTSFYNESGNKVLMDEKYSITQEFLNSEIEKNVFKYKPIISDNVNANLIKNILINYTAKLINRLDGTQIIRHGSLSTNNIKRYVTTLSRLNTKSFNNYSVYNKVINQKTTLNNNNSLIKNKYVKVFYNVNDINLSNLENGILNNNSIIFKKNTSTYKFTFKTKKENGSETYFDLSDLNTYIFVYKDNNGVENRINCTYSSNMNLLLGELEFNLTKTHIDKMINSKYNYFDIMVVNADGSNYTLFESNYEFQK